MKLILRFIALKMSILRVDAAIIKRKKVKRNVCPKVASHRTQWRSPECPCYCPREGYKVASLHKWNGRKAHTLLSP